MKKFLALFIFTVNSLAAAGILPSSLWFGTNVQTAADAATARSALGIDEGATNLARLGNHSTSAGLAVDDTGGDAGLRIKYGSADYILKVSGTNVTLVSAVDGSTPVYVADPPANAVLTFQSLTNLFVRITNNYAVLVPIDTPTDSPTNALLYSKFTAARNKTALRAKMTNIVSGVVTDGEIPVVDDTNLFSLPDVIFVGKLTNLLASGSPVTDANGSEFMNGLSVSNLALSGTGLKLPPTVGGTNELINYSGPASVLWMTDTNRGGLFVAGTYAVNGGHNNGTIFTNNTAGRVWVRQYSGDIFAPWFGTAGDGSTDDTLALSNACVTAIAAGKQLRLPKTPSYYLITGLGVRLTLTSNPLRLLSDGATLSFANGTELVPGSALGTNTAMFWLTSQGQVKGVAFDGLTMGPSDVTKSNVAYMVAMTADEGYSFTDTVMRNCAVTGGWSAGLYLTRSGAATTTPFTNLVVDNCRFVQATNANAGHYAYSGFGIYAKAVENASITRSSFKDWGRIYADAGHAVYIGDTAFALTSRNIRVSDCSFIGAPPAVSTAYNNVDVSFVDGVTLANNTFFDAHRGFAIGSGTNMTATGNTILGATDGFYCRSVTNVTISGNSIKATNSWGVRLRLCEDVNVSANTIEVGPSAAVGTEGSRRVTIVGNRLTATAGPVFIDDYSGTASSGIIVQNNLLSSPGDFIYVESGNDNVLSTGNLFYSSGTYGTTHTPIRVSATTATNIVSVGDSLFGTNTWRNPTWDGNGSSVRGPNLFVNRLQSLSNAVVQVPATTRHRILDYSQHSGYAIFQTTNTVPSAGADQAILYSSDTIGDGTARVWTKTESGKAAALALGHATTRTEARGSFTGEMMGSAATAGFESGWTLSDATDFTLPGTSYTYTNDTPAATETVTMTAPLRSILTPNRVYAMTLTLSGNCVLTNSAPPYPTITVTVGGNTAGTVAHNTSSLTVPAVRCGSYTNVIITLVTPAGAQLHTEFDTITVTPLNAGDMIHSHTYTAAALVPSATAAPYFEFSAAGMNAATANVKTNLLALSTATVTDAPEIIGQVVTTDNGGNWIARGKVFAVGADDYALDLHYNDPTLTTNIVTGSTDLVRWYWANAGYIYFGADADAADGEVSINTSTVEYKP